MSKWYRKKPLLILVAFGFIGSGFVFLWASTIKLPALNSFEERKITQSTKIYDRTGEILLYDFHENIKRTVISFDEISRNVKNATVAIEDSEFYQHRGIKPTAFLRAMLTNLINLEFSQGGSTITQQVVKNSLLTTDKKISRKIKEWILAVKLEKVLSKEEILSFYLNEAPYGGSIYGVEEASQSFFGKRSSDLTIAESAYLAAIPQAPTYYSPYGNNIEALNARKNLVLEKMLENSFITEEEFKQVKEEEVLFHPRGDQSIKAPHFVFYVISQLEEKYGKRALEEKGFKVITTLDFELQSKAEAIVKKYALSNKENFNAENAAMVAIDPKTGQILVMVGSRDYFDEEIDGNFNVALSHRQPGSAFKPFVYATAFEKGYTPDTVVFDLDTEFSTNCSPEGASLNGGECYHPQNYDLKFHGPISLRNALAQSVNIPAIKVLYLSGLQDSLETAKSMGIESLADISKLGLTLVLGGGEVSPLDITSAYGVFANSGVRNTYASILKIEDVSGKVIEEYKKDPVRVIPENIALTVSDILSDNDARTPAFGSFSPLYFPGRDVAAKTGTTNDSRDAWIVGYTPNVVVGAWAGNNDNSPMVKQVAGFIVAPMWNSFMKEVLNKIPEENFRPPKISEDNLKPILRGEWVGGETIEIDKRTGSPATENTPKDYIEERIIKDIHSILHWVDKKDPLGNPPQNPTKDSQYRLWEASVQKWVLENNFQ